MNAGKARHGVLAGGNWIVDQVKMINLWPAQDTLAMIGAQQIGNGGGPYNVLKALAKLECGFPLAGIGLLGADHQAAEILADCDAHGIERRALAQTNESPTSFTDVMTVASSGRRTFFHQPGANALLRSSHFDLTKSAAKIFYLGYLNLLPGLDEIDSAGQTAASMLFRQAREQGLITVADLVSNDTENFATVVHASLPQLDYLFLNEFELAKLTGQSAEISSAGLEAQARQLFAHGLHQAAIVHVPDKALLVPRIGPAVIHGAIQLPGELIAGTAGAGDAFAAGFLFGLHAGWEANRCLELGVCVAAASLRDATCSGGIESWKACLQLANRYGYHTPFL